MWVVGSVVVLEFRLLRGPHPAGCRGADVWVSGVRRSPCWAAMSRDGRR